MKKLLLSAALMVAAISFTNAQESKEVEKKAVNTEQTSKDCSKYDKAGTCSSSKKKKATSKKKAAKKATKTSTTKK